MARNKRDGMNRLVQTTINDETYRVLCEQSIIEDRSIASVIRQAINLYLVQIQRLRQVEKS